MYSQAAPSSSTFTVWSLTSEVAPPITPPSPSAPAGSATRMVKSLSLRSTPSRVVRVSPGSGRRVMRVGGWSPARRASTS